MPVPVLTIKYKDKYTNRKVENGKAFCRTENKKELNEQKKKPSATSCQCRKSRTISVTLTLVMKKMGIEKRA